MGVGYGSVGRGVSECVCFGRGMDERHCEPQGLSRKRT